MDMSWLAGKRLANYKTAWRTSGVTSMVNWYRASPLVIASPGMPAQMPCLPIKKLFVKCPHLLIWGINDVTLLPQSTDGLEEFAPNLTRSNIADADHWVLHQKPREVADIILDWMS